MDMPIATVIQKLETLNEDSLQEIERYISHLQMEQNKIHEERKFGTLEGKLSARFSNDWEMSDEELLDS